MGIDLNSALLLTGEMSVEGGAKMPDVPLAHPFILQSRVQQNFWANSGLGILGHKTAHPSDPHMKPSLPTEDNGKEDTVAI